MALDYVLGSSRDVSKEDVALAEISLKCKRKKKSDNDMKKKNKDKAKFKRKARMSSTNESLRKENTDQTFVVTNPMGISDKANFNHAEEVKCTWDLGKSLGLYASNDDDVINALTILHMGNEEGTRGARAKGKKGRK